YICRSEIDGTGARLEIVRSPLKRFAVRSPRTYSATSPDCNAGGDPGATPGFTTSTIVTETLPVGVAPSAMARFPDPAVSKTSQRVPESPPASEALSGRCDRSTLKLTVAVCPAEMLIAPACGTIHGTSATAMPVTVPGPLLLN